MSKESQIAKQLKELTSSDGVCFPVLVKSVNKKVNTVEVVDANDITYPDARLTALKTKGDNVVCFPEVDSVVQVIAVGKPDQGELLVVAIHKIESVQVEIGEITTLIDQEGIKLNGDQYGGLVDAKTLKLEVDKNTRAIRALQEVFKTFIPVPSDGGAALKVQAQAFAALPTADLSSIENNKVSHG